MPQIDLNVRAQWLPPPPTINVRATAFCIAEGRRVCWNCEANTAVFGYLLPRGHEVHQSLDAGREFESDEAYAAREESPESMGWVEQGTASVLRFVVYLPEKIQAHMASLTDTYRWDFSATMQMSYWMNHCQHCGAKQGDFEVVDEFDAPLSPIRPESASKVLLRVFFEPFEADGGVSALYENVVDFMQVAVVW